MKLKKVLMLFIAVLSIGSSSCSSDEEIIYFKDEILSKNNINDVLHCYEILDISNEPSVTFYCANRNYKEWFAVFDKATGQLIQEWYGKPWPYESGSPQLGVSGVRFAKSFNNGLYIVECKNIGTTFKLYKNGTIKRSNLEGILDAINEDFFFVRNDGGYISAVDFEGNDLGVNRIRSFQVDEKVGYIGYKGDKLWAAINQNDYKPIVGAQPHEMEKKIHIGYGEYKDIATNVFNVSCLKIKNGLALDNSIDYLYHEIICIDGEQINFVGLINPEGKSPINWYNNSILAYNHVISSKAEIIAKVKADNLSIYSNVFPLNYEECICTSRNTITRFSLNPSSETINWTSSISGIKDDARVTYEDPRKDKNVWTFKCHIVNKDGSKEARTILVNIENGELKELE